MNKSLTNLYISHIIYGKKIECSLHSISNFNKRAHNNRIINT